MGDTKGITVKEITRKVLSGDDIFILDVRNTDKFDDWRIEGKSVKIINKPYPDLSDGVDEIMGKLPKGEPVYVICAKGVSAKKAAEQIREQGYDNTYYVEGGMEAWSEHLEPIKVGDLTGGGALYQFVRIGKGCLSYIVESDGEGAVIDTNRMIGQYEEFLNSKNIKLKHLIDTHLHADHISGARELSNKTGGEYHLPPKDAEEVSFAYTPLKDGDEIKVGQSIIKAIYSPGHTIGSTSLIIDEKYLLTGDILFIDSIGRPDLAGKAEDWVADLRQTLYSRYKELTDELVVLPAHYMGINEMNADGSVFEKLGILYEKNHGLNIDDEEEFRKTVSENLPPQPNSHHDIRQTNMGKMEPDLGKQREMEIGPNRCAVR
ncbi:MBL fold metallo-hydrolase [Evansella sp. LMS18]|jgi:glyoxylase-like metal-dependent hydrolase (beta-lactamase superfamily II)|uniref:MBL fold metallo-hydrolase n=1 Tax=Evansella sp. LMS18 TaxID=2924033 RepID=UPI0020D1D93B|nr:MBL fold metallo-hydrolase [Evansella sp. LMS18]UTR11555.1 MBL fold metallo-hydrolase [Evansella sp. LMS18]